MKKHRQVILICTGLLLIGAFFVFAVPRVFHYLVERSVYDVSALESVGKYKDDGYYYSNMFANDSTYGKFIYAKAGFENNPYFKPVTQSDMDWVRVYIEHFSKCVDTFVGLDDRECADLVEHYDFDPACITAGDYVYFKEPVSEHDANENERDQFCLYYFDTESSTMYYLGRWIGYRSVAKSIGKFDSVLYNSKSSFRSFMSYEKCVYSVVKLEDNEYFKPITREEDMEKVRTWAGWCSSWAKDCKGSLSFRNRRFFKNYDFDPACITRDDYIYIESPGSKHESIYFFDTGSNTLHCFGG